MWHVETLAFAFLATNAEIDSVDSNLVDFLQTSRIGTQFQNEDEQVASTVGKKPPPYITDVASMYRDNQFHNFEHATHVTSSVKKLLKRIVNVDQDNAPKQDGATSIDL